MEGARPFDDGIRYEMAVKCGQLAAVRRSQGKKVAICYLTGIEQARSANSLYVK